MMWLEDRDRKIPVRILTAEGEISLLLQHFGPMCSAEIIRRSTYSHATIFKKLLDLASLRVITKARQANGSHIYSYNPAVKFPSLPLEKPSAWDRTEARAKQHEPPFPDAL